MKRQRINSLYRQFPKDCSLFVYYVHDLSLTVSIFAVSRVHAESLVRDYVYEVYELRSVFLSCVAEVDKNNIIVK